VRAAGLRQLLQLVIVRQELTFRVDVEDLDCGHLIPQGETTAQIEQYLDELTNGYLEIAKSI
jgi:hypothetical protein